MDIFDEELLKLWRNLNNSKVEYIMIGGIATNLHGYHRTTNDMAQGFFIKSKEIKRSI